MKVQETIREDGLHIISGRIPSKKVYMKLLAKVGSAYDQPDKRGLFHYFEHMAFKGTSNRTLQDIISFSRRNVLARNAYTGRIETGYWGEAVARKFPLLCEFLCDIFLIPYFLKKK